MRLRLSTALVVTAVLAVLAGAPAAVAGATSQPSIRIDSPVAYQVVQRDAHGRALISVRGTCQGVTGRVRVSWGDEHVDALVKADGTFSARLRAAAPGQATLSARSLSDPTARAHRRAVGVGDIFVVAGQSNAAGRGPNLTVATNPDYVACMFANDYRWKVLTDPVDSPVGQIDKVSMDLYAGGSVWPLVATQLMAAEHVPVAFIPCARGNMTMWRWGKDPARPYSRRTLYGSLVHRVRVAGGRVRAVLLLQGESDARWRVPPREYARQLARFAADLATDVRAPVVVGQSPDFPLTRYPAQSVDAIRDVQTRAEGLGANLRQGPSLYDIDLGGSWHISRPDEQAVAAQRWAACVLREVLGREVAAPPRLVSADYDGSHTVSLGYVGGALVPGPVEGFSVEAGGVPVRIDVASASDGSTVRLELADRPPAGAITVSLGLGRDGAGAAVPVEASPWRQPAPTVLRFPVAGR